MDKAVTIDLARGVTASARVATAGPTLPGGPSLLELSPGAYQVILRKR